MPPCTVSGGQTTDAQSAKIRHAAELNADAALRMILEPARDRARCASRGYITHPHVALATPGKFAAAESVIMPLWPQDASCFCPLLRGRNAVVHTFAPLHAAKIEELAVAQRALIHAHMMRRRVSTAARRRSMTQWLDGRGCSNCSCEEERSGHWSRDCLRRWLPRRSSARRQRRLCSAVQTA